MDKKRRKLMNGFHTVWDAEFKENESLVGRIALNKDVAFLKFSLKEVRITIFEMPFSLLGRCATTGQTSWTMHDPIGQRASRTQTTHVQEWSRWQGKSPGDRPRWHPDLHPQRHWKTPSKAQRSDWGKKIKLWNRFFHWYMIITRELSMTKDVLIWQMQSVVFWTRTKETVWWRLVIIYIKKYPQK